MKPKVVIDDKIPFIKGVLEPVADVRYVAGTSIDAACVSQADALIVRTRTRCDAALLARSSVRCVLTATIGYDHIDTEFCRQNNIFWKNAAGCNALAVQQYVAAALSFFCQKKNVPFSSLTIGVVGVGHVGVHVAHLCRALGANVLLNDPFKEKEDAENQYVPLKEIAERCDVITFHPLLTRAGEHPSFHLADAEFLSSLRRRPVLINAARGEIFDTPAVVDARRRGLCSGLAVDCWENEPRISRELLALADIATPHIAGYSADGKANATMACVEEFVRFFNLTLNLPPYPELPKPEDQPITSDSLPEILLSAYNIGRDSDALKAHPEQFENLRGNYSLRRDFKAFSVETKNRQTQNVLAEIGFKII